MIEKPRPIDIMLLAIVAFVAFALSGGCRDGKADTTIMGSCTGLPDPSAERAVVYLNDRRVGVMKTQGSSSRKMRWLEFRAPVGNNRLTVVSASGDTLSGFYHSHESASVAVCSMTHTLSSR